MSDRDDYEERPAEDPDELRREIRERGARVAYEALVGVCLDPKAPAPAKATAGTTILRVGGYLEKVDDRKDEGLQVDEARLAATLEELKRRAAALDRAQETARAAGAQTPAGPLEPTRPARKGKGKPGGGLFD
ncbi:MAG: hypothetical protein EKK29_08360 [Hyphomicrobiales bacterium]|nr:MAG: hypothetical protein EKK29_08360 [Hyphomicrobiales bacterium]